MREHINSAGAIAARIVAAVRSNEGEIQRLLERLLREVLDTAAGDDAAEQETRDFGQGVTLRVGERPMLFLSQDALLRREPAATAEVRQDGFYLGGVKVKPSRKSVLHPAMQRVQRRVAHVGSNGKLVQLSAYRQWYVERNGKLTKLEALKDPSKTRRRSASKVTISLEDLGL